MAAVVVAVIGVRITTATTGQEIDTAGEEVASIEVTVVSTEANRVKEAQNPHRKLRYR